jgi:hypothetical protein
MVNVAIAQEGGSVNVEEVEAAEAKMNAARDALMNSIEGRKAIDRDGHLRVARLKKAQADFLKAISELGN